MKTTAPRTYTNAVLTLIAGLLAINLLARSSPTSLPSSAHAQSAPPEDASGLVSAAEQRKVMIAELRAIAARLDRLDASLSKVMNVKVVEMPPVKVMDGAPKP